MLLHLEFAEVEDSFAGKARRLLLIVCNVLPFAFMGLSLKLTRQLSPFLLDQCRDALLNLSELFEIAIALEQNSLESDLVDLSEFGNVFRCDHVGIQNENRRRHEVVFKLARCLPDAGRICAHHRIASVILLSMGGEMLICNFTECFDFAQLLFS